MLAVSPYPCSRSQGFLSRLLSVFCILNSGGFDSLSSLLIFDSLFCTCSLHVWLWFPWVVYPMHDGWNFPMHMHTVGSVHMRWPLLFCLTKCWKITLLTKCLQKFPNNKMHTVYRPVAAHGHFRLVILMTAELLRTRTNLTKWNYIACPSYIRKRKKKNKRNIPAHSLKILNTGC